MKLLMISHKETWINPKVPGGYVTIGGFPFHVRAIDMLFDSTRLIVTLRASAMPSGVQPLVAPNLSILALPEPHGSDLRRKIALLAWLPRYLLTLWREIARADAVHTPVPGDIGFIGLLLALIQHKPLFVRHCGTWGEPVTISDKVLLWLLEKIAGGKNVVLATGGNDAPPSAKNPNIQWIFSTSLSRADIENVHVTQHWKRGEPLQLITVGRLSANKNAAAVIEALSFIQKEYPNTKLAIVGDGKTRRMLEELAVEKNVAKQTQFYGNVPRAKVLEILLQSHLFIFPTRVKEGFPKAVLEAMACGLPVIASNVSVIPRLIEHCGIVLSESNASCIAQAAFDLINNEDAMHEMAKKARSKSFEYSLERWRDEIGERLESAWGKLK